MAGGRGSRLYPITENIPKPLVTVGGVPVMDTILSLCVRHKIKRAAVSLGYLGYKISEYYDTHPVKKLSLDFFYESAPLGTAGGVANCFDGDFEDILVISGDAVTDIDIGAAVSFHYKSKAEATVILARRKDPRRYGTAILGDDGEILSFREKPSWENAVSGLVSTGIYIISANVLASVEKNKCSDFARDVFPKLIGKGLYGCVSDGYWCDIGTRGEYIACNNDVMLGKVGGIETAPDLHRPYGCTVSADTAMFGAFCGAGSVISSCVFYQGSSVGMKSTAISTVLGHGARIGDGCRAERLCVIGDGAEIYSGVCLPEGSVIPPGAKITLQSIILDGEIHGMEKRDVFREYGLELSGKTPLSLLTRYCPSVCSVLGQRGVFSCDGNAYSEAVMRMLSDGARLSGGRCSLSDAPGVTALSFTCAYGGYDYGIFVSGGGGTTKIFVKDGFGFTPDRLTMNKISDSVFGIPFNTMPSVREETYESILGSYSDFLAGEAMSLSGIRAVLGTGDRFLGSVIERLGGECEYTDKPSNEQGKLYVKTEEENFECAFCLSGRFVSTDRLHIYAHTVIKNREALVYSERKLPGMLIGLLEKEGSTAQYADTPEKRRELRSKPEYCDMYLQILYALKYLDARMKGEAEYDGESFFIMEHTADTGERGAVPTLEALVQSGGEITDSGVSFTFPDGQATVRAQDEYTLSITSQGTDESSACKVSDTVYELISDGIPPETGKNDNKNQNYFQ